MLIKKLQLVDGALKRAAALLFTRDPQKYFTGYYVKIGYFKTDADLIYQDEVRGDLFTQADKVIDLLTTKYLKAEISYHKLQRIKRFPVPEPALREAVLNSIAHKDYGSGIPIQISVYDDKIMIWNPGYLPEGWSVNRLLKKHPSKAYNPDVANTFFRAGMIEAWGRGIESIFEACEKFGIYSPEFNYETGGLWVIFNFKDVDTLGPSYKSFA